MNQGRVIVLGSINIDVRLEVDTFPLPGETVHARSMTRGLGGKGANQAVAASRAGVDAVLRGMVGDDPEALCMIRDIAPVLDIAGIGIAGHEPTGTAFVVVAASGQNEIIVTSGANGLVTGPDDLDIASNDLCVSQLEIPVTAIRAFFDEAHRRGARTILNFAPATNEGKTLLARADIVILNEVELASISGIDAFDADNIAGLVAAGRKSLGSVHQIMIVTLGAAGALLIEQSDHAYIPTRSTIAVDTTGAGDCFSGVFCAALADGMEPRAAIMRANIAASLQVERRGAAAAMPSYKEIGLIEQANGGQTGLAQDL